MNLASIARPRCPLTRPIPNETQVSFFALSSASPNGIRVTAGTSSCKATLIHSAHTTMWCRLEAGSTEQAKCISGAKHTFGDISKAPTSCAHPTCRWAADTWPPWQRVLYTSLIPTVQDISSAHTANSCQSTNSNIQRSRTC